jgi:DNA-directed RNA polymerase subunit RPC12/RpoP
MRFQRCTNSACARPYQVNEFQLKKAHAPGVIICPHCGHKEILFSNSVFLVHAMLPEQEAQFDAEHPPLRSDEAA